MADREDQRGLLPASAFDGKVVRGKDGWLFLDNDSNEFMRQQRGELLFAEQQLAQWREQLEARIAWLAGHGIPYRFLVAPNPHSVYPQNLPFDTGAVTERPVTQLVAHLAQMGSPAEILHPLEELVAARERPVFTQTNTHWTDLGAFVAYQALMDAIAGEIPLRKLTADDVGFHEVVTSGDLGHKAVPPETSVHLYATPHEQRATMTHDNRVFTNGHRIDYECPAAGASTCVVFGDSFAHAMLPFLAESFGRLTFAHLSTLDHSLVLDVKPDVVVSVMNERFLIRVPVDAGARSLEEWADDKRARGDVYPPRAYGGNRVDTPAPWKDGDVQAES